ncbi:MAG: zf-HC2 domain-containing protein [Synechococcales bacterium]|nr:zf-HC2 domain-containing protein [Synechococcales bacterium]
MALDNLKRDRFELLSAYLDGEVTAEERRQVKQWLESDPSIQCLYARLLKLRRTMQTMPIPVSPQSTEQTVEQVCNKIAQRRHRKTWAWGGAAIAALFVATFSSNIPGLELATNWYNNPEEEAIADTETADPDGLQGLTISPETSLPVAEEATAIIPENALMISVDQPLIPIPKAPVSSTRPSVDTAIDEAGEATPVSNEIL